MKKIIVALVIIMGIIFTIRFVFGGPEDSWICDKGQWVKHGNPSYPKPQVSCSKTALPRTKEECLAVGGVWEKQGPEPFETCDRKAKDRGNLCRDVSECEGTCQANLTREELSQGMRGKLNKSVRFGQCSVWVVELGCQGIVTNGKVQVLCID